MVRETDAVAELLGRESQIIPPPLPTLSEAPVVSPAPAVTTEAGPSEPPVDLDREQFTVEFQRMHGRLPTTVDQSAANAVPVLTRQLGRRPTRPELLRYLNQRVENPAARQQFEVISDAGPAGTV